MLLLQRIQNPFSNKKLRYSPETELINNFYKSHNSVLIANWFNNDPAFVQESQIREVKQTDTALLKHSFLKCIFQKLFLIWNTFLHVVSKTHYSLSNKTSTKMLYIEKNLKETRRAQTISARPSFLFRRTKDIQPLNALSIV